jgi:hypothetical protein
MPRVSIIDKDGILTDGMVNSSLANITWTEVVGTTETVITSGDDYNIETSGSVAGRLRVKKNLSPDTSLTLKFSATYTDSRTKQVFNVVASYLVKCNSSSKSEPQLSIDVDTGHKYNPLRDTAKLTVTASLFVNGGVCPAEYREFVWDLSHDGQTWETIGSSKLHYFLTVSSDGTQCEVDQSKMGEQFTLRCRAKYDEGGDPSSVTLTDGCPMQIATFSRSIPTLHVEIVGAQNIPGDATSNHYDLIVRDAMDVIEDYTSELLPMWYANAQTSVRTVQPTIERGHGVPFDMPTDFVSTTYGAVVGCDLKDRGALAALVDKDGAIMTDKDGAIMLIH